MSKFVLLYFLFAINLFGRSLAQNQQKDSLLKIINLNKKDTNEIKAIVALGQIAGLRIGNYDTALILAEQALIMSKSYQVKNNLDGLTLRNQESKAYYIIAVANYYLGNFSEAQRNYQITLKAKQDLNDRNGIIDCHLGLGNIQYHLGNYADALKNYMEARNISKFLREKKGLSVAYNGIGAVYYAQGNYPEALKYYFLSLKIKDELGDKKGIADSYNNIGTIYYASGNYPEALIKYSASLKIREQLGDKKGIADSYNNIGALYDSQGRYKEALINHFASLKLLEEIGSKQGIADSYSNIGSVYLSTSNYSEAKEYNFLALKIREEIGDKQGISESFINIGDIYLKCDQPNKSKSYYVKGLSLAKEIGDTESEKICYLGLSLCDSALANYKDALKNYKLYIQFRDSLLNQEKINKTIKQQMQYDFDKKQTADSIKVAEERKVSALKLKQEKSQRYYLYIGLVLVIIFAIFMVNRFRVTNMQKKLIEEQKKIVEQQKHLVDQKQKEILDSIHYAKRIQQALLPSNNFLERKIGNKKA